MNDIRYRVNKSYGFKYVPGAKVRWRCSTHERFGCRAKVHTIDNEIVFFFDEHFVDDRKKINDN